MDRAVAERGTGFAEREGKSSQADMEAGSLLSYLSGICITAYVGDSGESFEEAEWPKREKGQNADKM